MKCPRCQHENRAAAKFCEECATRLKALAPDRPHAPSYAEVTRALSEALEQQTATSEILGVISSSPTEIQPVFDAIADNAARLCEAEDVSILEDDGGVFRVATFRGEIKLRDFEGAPVSRGSVAGRTILDGQLVHVHDITAESEAEFPISKAFARQVGHRTMLATPLLRGASPIGVIFVRRTELRPFSERQIALLKTFADQAVIAIENVRLFKELQEKNRTLTHAHAQVIEALEQQTATSEILRVISGSPTDVQPVLDTIARNAVRLCGGVYSTLYRVEDGLIHFVAHHNFTPDQLDAWRRSFPRRVEGTGVPVQRVVRTGTVYRIGEPETQDEVDADALTRVGQRARGLHSLLIVPMFRQGQVIGAIGVTHRERSAFTDAHVELLKTFADQAVIAIENVRLFAELQERTHELTRSVDQLTALGDVGRAVSSSLDLDTVLTTIVSRAVQLSGTDGGTIFEYDETAEEFSARAMLNADEAQSALLRTTRLRRGEGAVGQLAVTMEPLQISDIAAEGAYAGRMRGALLEAGTRSVLAIPLLHEQRLVGGLVVTRRAPGAFTADTIELLRTFATQSALAIQNARLFREIEIKSRQLEVASQHKSEFLANMSHELRTPLNAIIGFSEVLSERMFGDLNEKQDEYLKDIYASGTHLLSLINDILDLSKIEAGRMELELTDFYLPAALDNALTLVRERAGRHSIGLHAAIDDGLEYIRADERKIKQVLLNLLSNAIKFTPEGGRIAVKAKPADGNIEVSVSDTGVGIAPEDQEAIFEEFRQVGTAAKKVEGTGLGLAVSRKFIELHGGTMWVKSEVGEGSTFTFTIPVRRGE